MRIEVKMETKHYFVVFMFLHQFLSYETTQGYLDLAELKSVNYGIDIVADPVVRSELEMSEAVYLASIYGQQYQCRIPLIAEENEAVRVQEQAAMDTGIVELLKPMQDGPCLMHTKDWWTYEFCYGKTIKQYHMEGGKVVGKTAILGLYSTEFDWSNSTVMKSSQKRSRYHSQEYINGTECDLIKKSRQAQVRFMCEPGHGDYLFRIDEPQTCTYTISIHTSKLCQHPFMKPIEPKKPVQITCNPLLSEEEYIEYQADVQAKKEAEENLFLEYQKSLAKKKALEEELKLLKEMQEEANKDYESLTEDDEDAVVTDEDEEEAATNNRVNKLGEEERIDEAMDAIQKLFTESLVQGLQDIMEQQGIKETGEVDERLLHENKLTDDIPLEDEDDIGLGTERKSTATVEKTEDELLSEKEDELLDEFEEELSDLAAKSVGKKHLSKYKETIESAMQAQFSEIMQEAEDEMGGDVDIDKEQAFRSLAQTLTKMIEKLQDDDDEEEDDVENGDASANIAGTAKDVPKTKPSSAPGSEPWGVRVVKIKHVVEDEELDEIADSPDLIDEKMKKILPQELKIAPEQKAKLESTMRAELQKRGMDAGDRKIEVKIITSGYYDKDSDELHLLDDEDNSAFNNMIITILQGHTEADDHQQQQKELEDNYGFTWGQNKDKKAHTEL